MIKFPKTALAFIITSGFVCVTQAAFQPTRDESTGRSSLSSSMAFDISSFQQVPTGETSLSSSTLNLSTLQTPADQDRVVSPLIATVPDVNVPSEPTSISHLPDVVPQEDKNEKAYQDITQQLTQEIGGALSLEEAPPSRAPSPSTGVSLGEELEEAEKATDDEEEMGLILNLPQTSINKSETHTSTTEDTPAMLVEISTPETTPTVSSHEKNSSSETV